MRIKTLLLFIILFQFTFFISFSQNSKVSSAEYLLATDVAKAKLKIDEALQSPKTKDMLRAYYVCGKVYQAVYQSEDANIKNLDSDPLKKSLDCFLKAKKQDAKGKYTLQFSTQHFNYIFSEYFTAGVNAYNIQNEEKALKNFKDSYQAASALSTEFVPNKDTLQMYPLQNIISLSFGNKDYAKVLEYEKAFLDLNFSDVNIHVFIAKAKLESGKEDEGIAFLQKAVKDHPEDPMPFLNELINVFLDAEKTEEASKYLTEAIQNDPKNPTYFFALGAMKEKTEDNAGAEENYLKAIELDPEHFNANFNLGARYVNTAIEIYDEANSTVDNKKHETLKKKANVSLLKALPYLEKCRELKPDEINVLRALKDIYLRHSDKKYQEKFSEIDARIKELEK